MTWQWSMNIIRWFDADLNSAWTHVPGCFSKSSLICDYLGIYLTTFSESVIWEIQKLWGSSFFSKRSKFQIHFKNREKKRKKLFFRDNCIWIGVVKFSLWRRRYFSLAANVLKSSPMIWHVNSRDFFQLNFLASDQWTW